MREINIVWLEVNATSGNYVLQRGHAPMLLVLAKNRSITYCLPSGKQESETISGGILKIDRTKVVILIDK